MAEQNIPIASEKKRLMIETRTARQNSCTVTPPNSRGIAMTGKIASKP